jgi:fatty-acyl-CoA synthase
MTHKGRGGYPGTAMPRHANPSSAVDVNLAAAVAHNARHWGEAIAIRADDRDLTYGDLDAEVLRLAGALAADGIGSGDRVAYLGLNSPEFLVTLLAAFRLGAIYVPVNFRLAGPELVEVLNTSGAMVLVCEGEYRAVVEGLWDGLSVASYLLVDSAGPAHESSTPSGWQLLSDLPPASTQAPPQRCDFDDSAILMFTSGTTGSPKGVVLTHGNIWWNSANVDQRLDTRVGDTTYAAAPLFHIGALNSFVLQTLRHVGTVVLRRSFDPVQFVHDLVTYRINSTFAVPAMLAAVARVPGVFDCDSSHLRAVVVGGAPVPPVLVEQFAEHGIWLQQAWGLTETAPFATHLPVEKTLDKLGSAGLAMPYTEVRVVSVDTGETLPAGMSGEVVVRGPNVTPGYWENPEANEAAFDDEGWFHSGDIGFFDGDGYLFIVDRLKDMIISGGENVYPAEVERILSAMDVLTDVAVVGTDDARWGETVVAVVAVADGAGVTLADLRSHAGELLAHYKLPRRLLVVEAVPRNASGKLDKARIRALVSDRTADT